MGAETTIVTTKDRQYRMTQHQKLKKLRGKCGLCGRKISDRMSGMRYITCLTCRQKNSREKFERIDAETGVVRLFAGMTKCKRDGCGHRFWSPDKRSVTHCDECRDWLELQESMLPCDMSRYGDDGKIGLAHKLNNKLKPGERNDSKRYAARLNALRQRDTVVAQFRRLSREEIDAFYTLDKIDEILRKAAMNRSACVVEFTQV